MRKDLAGKTAVIIGGSSGMGRACAMAFGQAGARVFIGARRREAVEKVAAEIIAQGGQATGRAVDVRRRADVLAFFDQVKKEWAQVDILVYAAGTNIPEREIKVLSEESWQDLLETNLSGALHCTQAVLPLLPDETGLVIYISTGASRHADRSGVAYQASKRGLDGIAFGAAQELKGERGLRFSVVYPGMCNTPLLDKRPVPTPPEVRAKILQPEDVAEACLYIALQPPRVYIPELVIYPTCQ